MLRRTSRASALVTAVRPSLPPRHLPPSLTSSSATRLSAGWRRFAGAAHRLCALPLVAAPTQLTSPRLYASTTPNNSSSDGAHHHDAAADVGASVQADSPVGGEASRGGGDAAEGTPIQSGDDLSNLPQHAPPYQTPLPPSAVELPEDSFLKCIDKEILDEKLRMDKEDGPPPVPVGWTMHHSEGTSFIYGRRLWQRPPVPVESAAAVASVGTGSSKDGVDATVGKGGSPVHRMERHLLRIQLTSRDASLDPECDVRGEHFPFSFFVQRLRSDADGADDDLGDDGDAFDEHTFYHDSIEARCDVVDGELVVDAVVHHGPPACVSSPPAGESLQPRYINPFGGYPGPNLDEAEEEVLDGIQSWLAERGVDDQLGEFVGQYSLWVEQAEYEAWLQQLRDYVAA